MREFTATGNDAGVRLSRFVERVTHSLPPSLLYKSFRNKRVKVNGKRALPEYRLAAGDVVQLYINDEFFAPEDAIHQRSPQPQNHSLTIVWQDESLAVLYKPAGVLCHVDNTGDATLLDAFTAHLQAVGEYDPAQANGFAPALCNRLDRGTEGLVLGAKRYAALRDANELLKQGLIHKIYLCITIGKPPVGIQQAFLARDKAGKQSRVAASPIPGGKPIKTGVQVLEEKNGLALCEVTLYTGRTHQIRAHLAFLGAPLLGDRRYGKPTQNAVYKAKTQALCAWRLCFDSELPESNTLCHLAGRCFEVPSPAVLALWHRL